MSLRKQLKVPQYGLFYFDCDRTISVVPTKHIKKVLSGDNTSKGSLVEISYAGVILKAEIIAVNDNPRTLHDAEVEFLNDPGNAHLFPEMVDPREEEADNATEQRKEKRKRKVPKTRPMEEKSVEKESQSPKQQKRRKETSKKKDGKSNQKKPATVITAFSPGKDNTVSSITSFTTPQQPATNHPVISSTPRSGQNMSAQSRASFSPRRLSYSHNFSFCSTPSSSLPYIPSVSSLSLPSVSFPVIPSPLGSPRHQTLEPDLRLMLERIERKLDILLENRSDEARLLGPLTIETAMEQDFNPVPGGSLSPVNIAPADNDELSPAVVRSVASSHMNFAVRLLRQFCTNDEMRGRNVAGCRGKQAIDQEKIAKIKRLVPQYYPVAPREQEKLWTECRKSMDSYLRRMNKKDN